MSTGITKASASMAAGNNSLEETFGLVAAGTEILREPGRVANGLSTITARLTAKNDEYIASITGGMGVIDKNTGELRSTFDILQDLSKAWKNLTSVEKQELTEVVAGKTQRSLFTAIMSNFDTAVGATEAALNSEGSALEENNKRMDSLNGKLTQLQSAWQSLARDTINSDFVKTLLDVATGFVKITNSIGGFQAYIPIIVSFFAIWKFDTIAKGFNSFLSMVEKAGGYFSTLKAISNETGMKMISVFNETTTAAGLLKLSIFGIGTALTAGIIIWNRYKQAQEDARQTAIDSANTHLEEAKTYKDKLSKQEDAIAKLQEEKTALESLSTQDDGTAQKIENKQKEIDKRQENIDKIKEEQKQASIKALGDVSGQKGSSDFFGATLSVPMGLLGDSKERQDTVKELGKINEQLKNVTDNSGAYNRVLEAQKNKYSNLLASQKKNNENYSSTEKVLEVLSKEQDRISEKYEKDTELAKVYYEALKNGVSEAEAGQEMVDWMQEFYALNESQMEQLEKGVDVLNEKTQATDNMTEAEKRYADQMSKLEEQESSFEQKVDENIDSLSKLQEKYTLLTQAQNEYKENGYLTADMYKQLKDADLLQYISDVGGKLEFNTKALEGNRNELITNAETAIKNAYSQKIMELALADQNGKLEETAEKLGLVTEESNKVSTANVVSQIGKIGLAAIGANSKLAKLFNTLKEKLGIGSGGSGFNVDDYTGSEQYQKYKAQLEEEMQADIDKINKIQLQKSTSKGSSSKGKTSKKDSKKTQEEYKAEIDTLYQYENALDNAKDEVDRLKDTLSDTDSYDEQEKYINQLIAALNNQIAKTQELKNAQSNQIQDYINQLRAQGFAIDYNAEKNELYINNMQHLADFSGDTAKSLEKIIKKIQDLNSNNRTLDGSVRDLTGSVKDYYDQLADIPEKKLEKFNDLMKEFQQSQLDAVQNQIDDLKREMEKDPRLAALEKEIEALEKENDTIDKQKEMEEKLLAVEEARQKLQNAMTQKTLQVYREGQGWVWEVDPDKVKEAQDELKDAQDALNEQIKDDKLDKLKEEQEAIKKSYQDQIDNLESFLDDQNYIIDKANREGIQSFEDLRKKLAEFGLDSAENLKKASDWLNQYNDALSKLNQTATTALSNSTAATNGLIYSSATQNRIDQALSGMNIDTTMTSTPVAKYDKIDQGTGGQNIYIDTIELPNVSNANEFVEALKDLPRLATTQSSSRK